MLRNTKSSETNIKPTEVNTNMIGCIDGRKAIFALEFNQATGQYEPTLNTKDLENLNYVEVLGAAFGFVAVVEEKLGLSMTQAFDIVEKALSQVVYKPNQAGYKPSFHADTHNKKNQDLTKRLQSLYKDSISASNEKARNQKTRKFVAEILKHLDGCGFAVYQWGEKAPQYIKEAVRRGWLIQVLSGNHEESKGGAHLNYIEGQSLSVAEANAKNSPEFTQDMWFITLVLQELAKVAEQDGKEVSNYFVDDSLKWFADTFAIVVVALGVNSKIQHHYEE